MAVDTGADVRGAIENNGWSEQACLKNRGGPDWISNVKPALERGQRPSSVL